MTQKERHLVKNSA